MRTYLHILFAFICAVSFHTTYGQIAHTEFKAKNFPLSQKVEFTKAFAAYKDGEKQYKLLVKENNMGLLNSTLWYFNTAYAFNPNHIDLNRYMVNLAFIQEKRSEAFPYLEKLFNLKAELTPDELFTLASLLQQKGSFTRAEIIFKRFQQLHGDADFWSEGRLQSPSKRIEECITGSEVVKQEVRFNNNDIFPNVIPSNVFGLYYNHFYGWWALLGAKPQLLSSTKKKDIQSIKVDNDAMIYSDINALVFLSCNDTIIKQVGGKRQLEVSKLNGSFSIRDPYLSNDLSLLYFSSDRPNGFGGYDIWMARFDDNGKLLSIRNAGEVVNDQYDQYSPSLSADETRFFVASNGKGTTGGFDILYGKYETDTVTKLKNLGFPVNSGYDEKEIIWDITGTKGFVKRMHDDSLVYVPFHETGSVKEALLIGTGFSSATVGPLSSNRYEAGVGESFINNICKLSLKISKPENVATEIEIFNLNDGNIFLKETLADTASTLSYVLPSQFNYGIHINGQGLVPFTANLDLKTDEVFLERKITAKLKPIKKNVSFILANISFSKDYIDMDKSSMYEIKRIADWLLRHPKVKVEIAVHTDQFSMHSTVIAAGESAAFQVYEELKKLGIEKKRLDWMFYGQEKPIYMGDNMTESAKNRRIELIITDK